MTNKFARSFELHNNQLTVYTFNCQNSEGNFSMLNFLCDLVTIFEYLTQHPLLDK